MDSVYWPLSRERSRYASLSFFLFDGCVFSTVVMVQALQTVNDPSRAIASGSDFFPDGRKSVLRFRARISSEFSNLPSSDNQAVCHNLDGIFSIGASSRLLTWFVDDATRMLLSHVAAGNKSREFSVSLFSHSSISVPGLSFRCPLQIFRDALLEAYGDGESEHILKLSVRNSRGRPGY